MIESFLTLLPSFVMVGLGYLLGKKDVIPPSSSKVFSTLVFYVAMPAYLFVRITTMPDFSTIPLAYIGAFALVQLSIGLITLIILKRRKYQFSEAVLGAMGACYTNSAFMGIPIIIILFGSALPILVITAYQVTLLTTVILFTHELAKNKNLAEKKQTGSENFIVFLKTIFLNPIILSSLSGFLVAKSGYSIPVSLRTILDFVGTPSISLALFALGLSLSNKDYNIHSKNPDVYFLVFFKSFVQPAAAFLVGRYLFHLPDLWLAPLVICAALPTAVHNYIFAEKYGQFQSESRDIVFYTSLLSLPIITLIFTALR